MKTKKFDFTDFLESKRAISICLAIGVLFLVNTYQKIMFMIDPENKDLFMYPYFLRVLLSHVDSLFFGFATIIIMFQSNKKSTKILYCTFESIMIFLNFNRNFISEAVGTNANVYIVTYISIFTGFTLFILGTLAKEHRKEAKAEQAQQKAEAQAEQERQRAEAQAQAEQERQRAESQAEQARQRAEAEAQAQAEQEKQKAEVQSQQYKTAFPDELPLNYSNNNAGFKIPNKVVQVLKKEEPEEQKSKSNRGRKPTPEEIKVLVKEDLKNGEGGNKTAKKYNLAKSTITKIKNK